MKADAQRCAHSAICVKCILKKCMHACLYALKICPGIPTIQEHNFYTYSKIEVRSKANKTVKQIDLFLSCDCRENAEMSAHSGGTLFMSHYCTQVPK